MISNLFPQEEYYIHSTVEKRKVESELSYFKLQGWSGVHSLLTNAGVSRATEMYFREIDKFLTPQEMATISEQHSFLNRPWFKSMHAFIPLFLEIASHPLILNRVSAILGEDIIVWGTTVTQRKPSQKHRWHIDIEHKYWKGVTAFVGLKGICKQSSIKLISCSHLQSKTPQELDVVTDSQALEISKEINPTCELINTEMNEGDFIIFDGLLWHASENNTTNERFGLIIQYTTPNNKIKIPLNWDEPVQWHSHSPPCILVLGKDRYKLNNTPRVNDTSIYNLPK